MAESLFTSLLNMFDPRDIRSISSAMGESEQSVSHGMRSSIATVLGNLTGKADDPDALRKTLDLVPSGIGDIAWSNVVETASDPQSSMISVGKRLTSSLFGSSESTVLNAIGKASGLRSNSTSTLMAVIAPFVLSFIGRKVRDEGLSMTDLGSILKRDMPAIRNALPAGLVDVFWPRAPITGAAAPVARSSMNWAIPLALAGLALLGFWLLTQSRRHTRVETSQQTGRQTSPMPTGTASREGSAARETTKQRPVLSGVDLMYETGSATLTPESQEQLNHVAAQLAASPDAHMKVDGYTDSMGNAERNLQLSQKRADNVKAALVREGVAPAQLTAKGYGEEDPIADNSTKEGRAQNRRVSVSPEMKSGE